MDWNRVRAALAQVGRAKNIDDTRKQIYEVSKMLPVDEGYELLKKFDSAIESAKQITRRAIEAERDERDESNKTV